MVDELNAALKIYSASWQKLVQSRKDTKFFKDLQPTAVGWKVADRTEYDHMLASLHDQADLIIQTWMNGRWIAKVHLQDAELEGGIRILKVMERRPGSSDAVGLDHLDFYSPAVSGAEAILQKEPDLKWSRESNDVLEGYDWISVWFDGTEAKLKTDTVLDIIITELQQLNKKITTA
jgi:hypothetical protein